MFKDAAKYGYLTTMKYIISLNLEDTNPAADDNEALRLAAENVH